MKTTLVLATGLSLSAVNNSSAVRLTFVNRDDDGADEFDRLEESIHKDLDYNDILQFSENVKEGNISADSQAAEEVPKSDKVKDADEKPIEVTINVTVAGEDQGGAKPAGGKATADPKPVVLKGDDRIKKITLTRMDPKKLSSPTPLPEEAKKSVPEKKEAAKKDDKSKNENKQNLKLQKAQDKPKDEKIKSEQSKQNKVEPKPKDDAKKMDDKSKSDTKSKDQEKPKEKQLIQGPQKLKLAAVKPAAKAPASVLTKVDAKAAPARAASVAAKAPVAPSAPVITQAPVVAAAPKPAATSAAAASPVAPAIAKPASAPAATVLKNKSGEKVTTLIMGEKKKAVAKRKKAAKKVEKKTDEEEDPFDYYNQQLPTADNDIYNFGDKTQSLINDRLAKQQQLIRQNDILEEDEKLQQEVDETSDEQIAKGTDILNENRLTMDNAIENATHEYLQTKEIRANLEKPLLKSFIKT